MSLRKHAARGGDSAADDAEWAVPTVIQAADDPLVADYVRLTDVALRRRVEPRHGLFIAEGELVVRRAVESGYPVRSLLLQERYADRLSSLAGSAPVYVATPEVLAAITGFDVHRGVLAAMGRRPLPDAASVLASSARVVVLEGMNNSTNVGAVFRCAAALGIDAVLLSPRCADPLYRRSVRVSMGAVFAVPHARLDPWPGALELARAHGYRLLALTPDPSATPLEALDVELAPRLAILLGAEGSGLTNAALELADDRVRIPMAAGVDSLNVAAAAAVACYVVGHRPAGSADPARP